MVGEGEKRPPEEAEFDTAELVTELDASMLGSALKITSLGWKTSTAPTFPQRGHWNSVRCSRLDLDTYHDIFCILQQNDEGPALPANLQPQLRDEMCTVTLV